jgi:adenylate kinase family enzyme
MELIAFTGLSGAGKDYQAQKLQEHFGFKHLKFAMGLRGLVYSQLGIHGILTKEQEISSGIQDLLVSESRKVLSEDPLLWVDILDTVWWLKVTHSTDRWVISDLRQPHELEYVRNFGGSIYRVTRESQAPEQPLDRLLDSYELPAWDLEKYYPAKKNLTCTYDPDPERTLLDRISEFHTNPYEVMAWSLRYYDDLNP